MVETNQGINAIPVFKENTERTTANVNDLLIEEDVVAALEVLAAEKNLKVFTFKDDELEKYYPQASPAIGVALMSKNLDGAIWNLRNQRRLLLFRK